jgi:hypothetical protein
MRDWFLPLVEEKPIQSEGTEMHPISLQRPIPGSAMLRKATRPGKRREEISQRLETFWSLALPNTFENSLADIASRLVRHSLREPWRLGEVGSFRRRGEVGRTRTSTIGPRIGFIPNCPFV